MTIAICAIACGVLLVAEYQNLARVRTIAKCVASAAFVARGLPALGAGPFETLVVVGLVFGALGDVALLRRGNGWFLAGLVLFLIGHLLYVVGLAQLESPLYWFFLSGRFGTFALVGGVLALSWLWPHLGPFKWPVVIYVLAIVAMVMGAFAAYNTGALPRPQRSYLAVGAALFFASDLAVARERFVARDIRNRLWGLPAYYAAQLLIASAL